MELDFTEELSSLNAKPSGLFTDMEMSEYRSIDSLASSELQAFDINPSNYVWQKIAPVDVTKSTTADFGTALHTKLLEPHLFDASVVVSDVKGRTAAAFRQVQERFKDKIVITESEYDQIELMAESAKCHPMYSRALRNKGACEASIFVNDPATGLDLKIRPDKIIERGDNIILGDVKTTASINDWRQDKPWLNPLFKIGYGFTAAYYLYVGSIHYGIELDKYAFLVSQKSVELGKYPVAVFIITKEELIEYGFWEQMTDALSRYKQCLEQSKWSTFEEFPKFNIYNDEEIEIKIEGE